jgi:hypothetical protein
VIPEGESTGLYLKLLTAKSPNRINTCIGATSPCFLRYRISNTSLMVVSHILRNNVEFVQTENVIAVDLSYNL